MMLKDLKLAQAAARATRATTPLGAGAAAVYEQFVESGDGSVDFSGIIRYLRGDVNGRMRIAHRVPYRICPSDA